MGLVIAPLLSHCDNRKLWESENAITWAELFMKSVRETYRQNIVKLILGNFRYSKIPVFKKYKKFSWHFQAIGQNIMIKIVLILQPSYSGHCKERRLVRTPKTVTGISSE